MGLLVSNITEIAAFYFDGHKLHAIVSFFANTAITKESIVISELNASGVVVVRSAVKSISSNRDEFDEIVKRKVSKYRADSMIKFDDDMHAYYLGPIADCNDLADARSLVNKIATEIDKEFAERPNDWYYYNLSVYDVQFLSHSKRDSVLRRVFKALVPEDIYEKVREASVLRERLDEIQLEIEMYTNTVKNRCLRYEALRVIVVGENLESVRRDIKSLAGIDYESPEWDAALDSMLREKDRAFYITVNSDPGKKVIDLRVEIMRIVDKLASLLNERKEMLKKIEGDSDG